MTSLALQDVPPIAGHSPDQDRPLGAYTALMGLFLVVCAPSHRRAPDLSLLPRPLGQRAVSRRPGGVAAARSLARLCIRVLTGADVLQIVYKQPEDKL